MNRDSIYTLLLVLAILFLIAIVIYRSFYKPILDHIDVESFEDFKKAKEDSPVCVKPFAIVNDKDKVFEALKILNQKVDEIEYDLHRKEKQNEEVYKWYKLKTDKDSKEAKKLVDEGNAKLQQQFADVAKKSESAYYEANKEKIEKDLAEAKKKDSGTINDILGSTSKKADADDKKAMEAEIKNAGVPSGFF